MLDNGYPSRQDGVIMLAWTTLCAHKKNGESFLHIVNPLLIKLVWSRSGLSLIKF